MTKPSDPHPLHHGRQSEDRNRGILLAFQCNLCTSQVWGLVQILFPLKFHQINHSSKEADTHLHTTRNRLVPEDGTLCPVVTPGIQLGLHQLFQAGKTTTPSHALPLTAPILHSSQYPCPLPHDCHFSMQIRISLPCDNGLDYVTCFDQQDINR